MAHFNEVFPTNISYGSRSGKRRNTRVVVAGSGYEQRLKMWKHSRRVFDVAYGMRHFEDLLEVMAFFEAVGGRFNTFLYKDQLDFNSSNVSSEEDITPLDQNIGTGDGATLEFQLRKRYAVGNEIYYKDITRPNESTVRVAVDNVEQASGWSVDDETGIVTFDTPPPDTHVVTAGFEYYVKARFDIDEISASGDTFLHGEIDSIVLVEVLEGLGASS